MAATCSQTGERVSAKACPESGHLAAGPPRATSSLRDLRQAQGGGGNGQGLWSPRRCLESRLSPSAVCLADPCPPPTPHPGSEPRSLGGPSYHVPGQGVGGWGGSVTRQRTRWLLQLCAGPAGQRCQLAPHGAVGLLPVDVQGRGGGSALEGSRPLCQGDPWWDESGRERDPGGLA